MNNRKLFNDKEELESSMLNYLNLQKEKQDNETNNNVNTILVLKMPAVIAILSDFRNAYCIIICAKNPITA